MKKILSLLCLICLSFLVGCNPPAEDQGIYYNVLNSNSYIEVYSDTCDLINVNIIGLGISTYYDVEFTITDNGSRINITHVDFSAVASFDGTTISYNNQNFKKAS